MRLSIGIETGSDPYQIVLGQDEDGRVLFDTLENDICASRDLAILVSQGLKAVGALPKDLASIVINIGPGTLSSVRSGVSFANALAFSLGIPIYPFNCFEVIGTQARTNTSAPVLCAVPAAAGTAYVGLAIDGLVTAMRYGPLMEVVEEIVVELDEVAVAGRLRERLSELLSNARVIDTGIGRPSAITLLQMGLLARQQGKNPVFQVAPLNEQAAVFYEHR